MMLEDRVRDALDDLVRRLPPRTGLADAVLREAHRRRVKVRIATAGGAAVAVAAGTAFVVADPLAGTGPDLGTVGPAAGQPTGPDNSQGQAAAEPVTVDLDLTQLGEGRSPSGTPWVTGNTVHVDDQDFALPDILVGVRAVEQVASGVAVLAVVSSTSQEETDSQLVLLSPDGGRTVLAGGAIYDFAVSADGALIAWAEHDWATHTPDDGPRRTMLYAADAATGEVLHERVQSGDDGSMGSVRGFLDDGRVVLDAATNAPTGLALWDPQAGSVTPWSGYGFAAAVAPAGGLAVLSPRNQDTNQASGVVGPDGQPRWELPVDSYVPEQGFSPDGRYLAAIVAPGLTEETERAEREIDDVGGLVNISVPRSLVVFDATTGERVLTIDGTVPGTAVWESAGNVVFEVWDDDFTTVGLVRCALDGSCELAAPLQNADDGSVPHLGGQS